MIAFAIVFVALLFFLNNRDLFKRQIQTVSGLAYNSNELLADLVNRDTDGDGVLDWEEALWGTDPTKKDTDMNGLGDKEEIEKMKSAKGVTSEDSVGSGTATDKFSRELFATVATLSQAGELDEATVEKLTESISTQIVNAPEKRVFTPLDIKVSGDNSKQAILAYNETLNAAYKKYPMQGNVIDILEEFAGGGESANANVLLKLNPIITQTENLITAIVEAPVPLSIAKPHLDFINSMQALKENMENLQLFETDPIVSLGAISQYETNTILLNEAVTDLTTAMTEQLRILR